MRSQLRLLVVAAVGITLAACDSRPAVDGGGGSSPITGAHTIHLTGSPLAEPVTCEQCHAPNFDVTLRGDLAAANGAQGTFSAASATCSNVYCHAGGPALPLGGGTLTAPVWNPPSTVACGACHATPGGAVPTADWHPAVATGVDCAICHPGYTVSEVNRPLHVNGVADLTVADMATNCAACHGDASRVLPEGAPAVLKAAPPVDRTGSSATAEPGVGAHQAHLLPGTGAISPPIACSECHAVPTDLAHVGPAPTSPAKMAWGPLASASGASPAYDASAGTCTNYCHGQTLAAGGVLTEPAWTRVHEGQAACGTCHGSPPADASHQLHAGPAILDIACSHCHPDGYSIRAVGPDAVPLHVNGRVDTSEVFLPDWNPAAVGPTGWAGTSVVGCHGGTRYWSATSASVNGCF